MYIHTNYECTDCIFMIRNADELGMLMILVAQIDYIYNSDMIRMEMPDW